MENYFNIVQNTVFTSFIGLFAPFLYPYLFKIVGKWSKRELTKQEKRLLVGLVSFLVSLVIVAIGFDWQGELTERIMAFLMYIVLNFATLRGVVQSIYELVIKNIPSLDEELDRIEKGN